MTQLASDLNNPEFTGAVNPDSKLTVRFYSRPVQNMFETNKQGRPIFEDRDYVEIFIPGDSTSIVDVPVKEEHMKRFPLHWAYYKNLGENKNVGTPLSQWPLLTPAQAEEMKHIKFTTVESIAFASDLQLQTINMLAGMNPMTLRDKAKAFLQYAKDSSIAVHQAEELKKRDEKIENLESKIQELINKFNKDDKPKRKYTKKVKNDNDASASPASL